MSKRYLSPAPLPPPKRLHISSNSPPVHSTPRRPLSFDDSLYDELILCIFSHLSWVDLCAAQSTSKNWCRLAADNELWRNLYLSAFARPRLRGARGFHARSDGREVRPLPGRVASSDTLKDWKWMFRISSNWRKGRCGIEHLDTHLPPDNMESNITYPVHILLAGPLTITASSRPTLHPTIDIFSPPRVNHVLHCDSQLSNNLSRITTIAIDQAHSSLGHIRLASFLSTGEITIFSINSLHFSTPYTRLAHIPGQGNTSNSPILQAVYHHPLLVTLSNNFSISLYDVSSDIPRHRQTLTSFTSFPPTSLVLSTPTPTTYKLVVAYATPVYPSHWSIGATELVISGPAQGVPGSPPALSQATVDHMSVRSTRTVRAFDVPQGWIDNAKLLAIRAQWARKVSRVADTQTDGKWVVVAPGESIHPPPLGTASAVSNQYINSTTTLQLYRLHLPSTNSVASPPPKLTFVRNLYGQIGPVSSLALADGRCVSLGVNGSIWVWDLEAGTGAEVLLTSGLERSRRGDTVKGMVAFDERRIVTSEASQIIIRRFDV